VGKFIDSGLPVDDGTINRFFFRRNAEKECWTLNCLTLAHGYKDWTYHIHDRREDV
jgi:hypothetical protein